MKYLNVTFIFILVAVFSCTIAIKKSDATVFTLEDANSSVDINTGTQAGMFKWSVDGVDHISKQWFWYRTGGGAEASLDTLTIDAQGSLNTDFDSKKDTLYIRYKDTAFTVEVLYSLLGGAAGSGASQLSEQITVNNMTSVPLDFHFFQYADMDLGGTPGDDEAKIINTNTIQQWDATTFAETVVTTSQLSHWEIDILDSSNDIIDILNDSSPTTLTDSSSSLGPGNVTWAMEWDVTIAGNDSFQISKLKQITAVPEPETLFLLSFGLAGIVSLRLRKLIKKEALL